MKLLCLSDYLPDRALPLQLYLTLAATPSRGVIVASRLCIFNKMAKFCFLGTQNVSFVTTCFLLPTPTSSIATDDIHYRALY